MASFFPKALLYKEWRQQRLLALLVFAVVGVLPFFTLTNDMLRVWSASNEYWHMYLSNLQWNLASYLHATLYTQGSTSTDYLPFAAALFGTAVLSYERSQGGLWFTLSGPVTRREVLRVKAALGVLQVFVIVTVYGLYLLMIDLSTPVDIPVCVFFTWWAVELLVCIAMFLTGLLAATAVGSLVGAPVIGLVWASIPQMIAAFLEIASSLTGLDYQVVTHNINWMNIFGPFSPLYYIRGWHGIPSLFAIWILLWAVLAYLLAQRCFHRMPIERMTNFFVFPVLWKWLIFGVCLIFACAVTLLLSGGQSLRWQVFIVLYPVLTALFWFLVTWLIHVYRRKYLEV